MTIVCEISAKDLLSQLNFFFRSNWIPSKNSINIHFSSYFYSIQAAGIGLWGFAKEIAGDLIHWNQNWLLSNTLQTLWQKKFLIHIKSDKLFSSIFQNYFWHTNEICNGTDWAVMDLLFPKFLRDRVQNICQEFTFPAQVPLWRQFNAGKKFNKSGKGACIHFSAYFNIQCKRQWLVCWVCRLDGRGFSLLKPNYVSPEQTSFPDFWKKS